MVLYSYRMENFDKSVSMRDIVIVQMKESCYAWKESNIDCPLYYSLKLRKAPLGAMIPNHHVFL